MLSLILAIGVAAPLRGARASGIRELAGIRSLSPVPESSLHLPQTNIIVGLDHPVVSAEGELTTAIVVTGSLSGRHSGRTTVSRDRRTVVFKPDQSFTYGELVRVDLRAPLTTTSQGAAFSFTITRARPAVSASMAAEWMSDIVPAASRNRAVPFRRSARADTLPVDYPDIGFSVYDSAAVSAGVLFLSNLSFGPPNVPYLLVLDHTGAPLFCRKMTDNCLDFKVQPNGLMSYIDQVVGKVFVMDATFAVIDSFSCGNGYFTDPHDARLLPNGHALLMSYDPEPVDMSQVVAGGNPNATVIGLILQEVDDQQNVYFQWRSWDHFQITDTAHEDLTAARIDYVHGNAIEIDADGNLLISSRHLDEITKIDRVTGDVLWRWGGRRNEFTFVGDTLHFNYQHAIRLIANGDYTLWDNGNYHIPQFSRAVEYKLDQAARTAELIWEHREDPDVFGGAMGYVQRLDSGNTLIAMGAGKPDIFEVTPQGTKVTQLTLPDGIFSYRAYRFPLPVAPPPSDTRTVQLLSNAAPNPFRDRATVTLRLASATEVTLVLYDLNGREIRRILNHTSVPSGSQKVPVDLQGLGSGLYFLKATGPGIEETRKLLLVR
jgi:hypothetical protein